VVLSFENCPSKFSNLAGKTRKTLEALNKQQKSNYVVSNSGTIPHITQVSITSIRNSPPLKISTRWYLEEDIFTAIGGVVADAYGFTGWRDVELGMPYFHSFQCELIIAYLGGEAVIITRNGVSRRQVAPLHQMNSCILQGQTHFSVVWAYIGVVWYEYALAENVQQVPTENNFTVDVVIPASKRYLNQIMYWICIGLRYIASRSIEPCTELALPGGWMNIAENSLKENSQVFVFIDYMWHICVSTYRSSILKTEFETTNISLMLRPTR